MKNLQKIAPYLLVIAVIGVIATAVILKEQKDVTEEQKQAQIEQEKNDSYGDSMQDNIVVLDLIGTSATTPLTFPESTSETNWDTKLVNYPHHYGATPTAAFLINGAESVTLDVWYAPTNTDSLMYLTVLGSNDVGCNNPSSTLNQSNWFPMPIVPTTSPEYLAPLVIAPFSTTSIAKFEPASTSIQKASLALPTEWLNFNCLQVQAYNSSTTDNSLVWLEVSILR